jgi:tetratricopeptide (TPR) repeat protein
LSNLFLSRLQSFILKLNLKQIFLMLSVLGLIIYANTLSYPFVHDDVFFIKNNPHIADLNLKQIFNKASFDDPQLKFVNTYYRPLLETFNRVLYKIFKLNPFGYHFINIILHVINSFFVFLVLNLILDRKKIGALVVAIFFLVHPVQTEAVACISGISNLIFAFLCLLSFFLYLLSQKGSFKQRTSFYILSLIIFFIGLLAKEQSIILPGLVFMYELCRVGLKKEAIVRGVRTLGFFFVAGLYLLLRYFMFGHALSSSLSADAELNLRLLAVPKAILTHLGLILFPHDLHYYRNIDLLSSNTGSFIGFALIIILIICFISFLARRQWRILIFFLSWFGLALLPTVNIIPMVNEYSFVLTAEHFVYFPIIGILTCSVLAISGLSAYKKKARFYNFVLKGSLYLMIVFSFMTTYQNQYWANEIVLFERTLQFEKDFGRVHNLLADAYHKDGQFERSIEENKKALKIMSGYLRKVRNPEVQKFYLRFIQKIIFMIATAYEDLNELDQGAYYYRYALRFDTKSSVLYQRLARNALRQKDFSLAITYFKRALELDSQNLMYYNSLALCYIEEKGFIEAEALLRYVVEHDPNSQSAKVNLNNLLQRMDKK